MNHQRRFKRAPYFEEVLLVDKQTAHLSNGLNISKNGILISNILSKINSTELYLMFPIINYPEFSLMDRESLFLLNQDDLDSKIFRCKAVLMRKTSYHEEQIGDYLEIGVELTNTNDELSKFINRYVETFESNIEFILTLYQDQDQQRSTLLIRTLLKMLGYSNESKLSISRSKILHDYNSLLKL